MTSIRSNRLVSRRLTRLFCLAAFLILAFSAGSAQAQDEKKTQDPDRVIPYIEYMAGVSIVPNQTLSGKGATGAGLMGSARPDAPGYFVGGALGAKFLQYFRSELQIGYRSTDVQNISVQGEPAGTSVAKA